MTWQFLSPIKTETARICVTDMTLHCCIVNISTFSTENTSSISDGMCVAHICLYISEVQSTYKNKLKHHYNHFKQNISRKKTLFTVLVDCVHDRVLEFY